MGGLTQILRPNKKQEEFFNSQHRYTAYGGARGGGKSWAMRTKFILLAVKHPGIQILLLRRSLGELRDNHIVPLLKMLSDTASYSETKKEFLFPNGSRIKLGYCDGEQDVLQYQGQAYEVIGMEEATHFTYFQFQCLTECNRYSGNMAEKFRPRMYFTCNPGGVGHDWVKRLFIDKLYRDGEDPSDYRFIQSLVFDNKYLTENDPDYVSALSALPDARKRAMLYGDWDAFEGAFFPEFDTRIHVVRDPSIPKNAFLFRALDYGLDMTSCLWCAADGKGNITVYREFNAPNLILSQAAAEICARTPAGEKIRYTVASPDLWNRRQESGKSGFDILNSNGLKGLIKANNARIPGWRAVREYLNPKNGKSRLAISADCGELIRCLPLLRFDEKVREDASSHPHDITHAPEALRYALMSREPALKSKTTQKFRRSLYSFESPQRNEGYDGIIQYD